MVEAREKVTDGDGYLHRKLQAEKCSEHGDMCAHLNKLQTMHEDLASMGASILDKDLLQLFLDQSCLCMTLIWMPLLLHLLHN